MKGHAYQIVGGGLVFCSDDCPAEAPHWEGQGPVDYTMVNGTKEWVVRVGKQGPA